MQEWLAAVISGASAIGGGTVVAVSNYVINGVQARDSQNTELRAATAAFLQSIDMITLRLRTEHKPGLVVKAMNDAVARFAPTLDANLNHLHERIFTPHNQALLEFFSGAANRLLLVAPNEMLGPMDEMAQLMGRADQRDDAWDKQWEEARARLAVIARRLLGHDVPSTPATATQPNAPA